MGNFDWCGVFGPDISEAVETHRDGRCEGVLDNKGEDNKRELLEVA